MARSIGNERTDRRATTASSSDVPRKRTFDRSTLEIDARDALAAHAGALPRAEELEPPATRPAWTWPPRCCRPARPRRRRSRPVVLMSGNVEPGRRAARKRLRSPISRCCSARKSSRCSTRRSSSTRGSRSSPSSAPRRAATTGDGVGLMRRRRIVLARGGRPVARAARAGARRQCRAAPDLDFLEYLGSWQADDDEWLEIAEWEKDNS